MTEELHSFLTDPRQTSASRERKMTGASLAGNNNNCNFLESSPKFRTNASCPGVVLCVIWNCRGNSPT